MLNTIIKGRTQAPPRILLYGMEGIGKSTFAAHFPAPVFIQTEDGLGNINCERFPLATSYLDVLEQLVALQTEEHNYQTVVVDSLDWLERLIWDNVATNAKVDSIESIGYGRGYTIALNNWRKILDITTKLREKGMIVLFLAHALAEDYTDPEVTGLKRFTPRLHKTARSLLAEYVDLILLATRKFGAANGNENNPRIVRTEATPYQVAKSRYSIPSEMPLDASVVLDAIRESVKRQGDGDMERKINKGLELARA